MKLAHSMHGLGWFVWAAALHPSQPFFIHTGTFSWVEPVPSNLAQGHNTAPLLRFVARDLCTNIEPRQMIPFRKRTTLLEDS